MEFIGPRPLAGAAGVWGVCGQSLGAGPGARPGRGSARRGPGEGSGGGPGRRPARSSLSLWVSPAARAPNPGKRARCVTRSQCAHLSEPQRPLAKWWRCTANRERRGIALKREDSGVLPPPLGIWYTEGDNSTTSPHGFVMKMKCVNIYKVFGTASVSW